MKLSKYIFSFLSVLLTASPSFAYNKLDDLTLIGGPCYISGDDKNSSTGKCLEDTVKSLKPGMWGIPAFDDKTQVDIIGNSVCVDYRGKQKLGQAADNQSYFDEPSDGGVCYCQMTGPETSSWMLSGEYEDYEDCNARCASDCAKIIDKNQASIRTNMFKTVNYGGVDYSWLYDTTGTEGHCWVSFNGKFVDEDCPSGTDKIITEPRQWAAVLDSKEHPKTLVTGTAWVSDIIDTSEYGIGYIPTDSTAIDKINSKYESFTPGDNPGGKYCYCKMETPGESSWVLSDFNGMDLANCTDYCANNTSKRGLDTGGTNLTDAMFSTLKSAAGGMSMVVTTKKYVKDLLGTKQDKITTTGTNKLMTFGTGTGDTPGSRDIVSTLGTSTSATTVPETGPIVAGMNSKQNAVNGTANFVMTGTGTAGAMNSKPVYSATNNYPNALVTAQIINTAAANAANSEFGCTRYVDGAPQTDANCLLWGINTTAPAGMDVSRFWVADPTINGTSRCYRRLNGDTVTNGDCGPDTLSYLGASGNKSGKWGVVFPYGDISGISVCSTQLGTYQNAATDAQSAILDNEYAAQADNGTWVSDQKKCWCKMENPTVSGSPWVYSGIYNYTINGVNACGLNCASVCSSDAASAVAFRSAMFGI